MITQTDKNATEQTVLRRFRIKNKIETKLMDIILHKVMFTLWYCYSPNRYSDSFAESYTNGND